MDASYAIGFIYLNGILILLHYSCGVFPCVNSSDCFFCSLTSTPQSEKSKIEERKKVEEQDAIKLMKEKDDHNREIAILKQELEIARKTYEQKCLQMETESTGSHQELEERLKELGNLLTESRNKVKLLEASTESKSEKWNKKENSYRKFTEVQLVALRVGHYNFLSI